MNHKKSRLLSIILALVLVFGLSSTALAAPITFSDVPSNAWYYNDVYKAVDTGLINGYPNGTFGPNKNMSYSEAIKLAAVMYKLSMTGSTEFEQGSPWYQPYVDYAKNVGIISKDYDWNKEATRAGYMEIFAKAIPDTPAMAGVKGLDAINTVSDGSIPDVPMTHPQAAAIYKLYRAGIVQGSDDQHNCNPNSNIRRSEVAAILTRMMNAGERISFSMGQATVLKITSQPADVTVGVGQTAAFSVAVSGGKAPYTYYWEEENAYLNEGGTYQGVKAATLTVKSAQMNLNNDKYFCVITDADGNKVTSRKATLTVTAAAAELKITSQPKDVTIEEGGDATFTVKVTGGTLPYKYEWYLNENQNPFEDGLLFSGAATDTFTTKNCGLNENGYKYYCVITDAAGNKVTSNRAATIVTAAASQLVANASPNNVSVNAGQMFTATVSASGGKAPYSYQWYVGTNSADVYGSGWSISTTYGSSTGTSYTHSVNMDQSPNDTAKRYYVCKVTDASGNSVYSNVLTVTWKKVPEMKVTISANTGTTLKVGQYVTFNTSITGNTGICHYKWVRNTTNSTLTGVYVGEDKSFYSCTSSSAGVWYFYVDVTDATNNTVSSNVIAVRWTD